MNQVLIKIKPGFEKLYEQNSGIQTEGSTAFDLINIHEVNFLPYLGPQDEPQFQEIDLGVVIKVPEGYHSILIPRSSTFKKYGIIMANSLGLVDEDYSGDRDIWAFPAICLRREGVTIPAGTRIAQFFIEKKEKFQASFVSFDFLFREGSRGGRGSTGI